MCGLVRRSFVSKQDIDHKLDRIGQISRYISTLMDRSTRTKIRTTAFIENTRLAERRTYEAVCTEIFFMFVITAWQSLRIKKMISHKRIV